MFGTAAGSDRWFGSLGYARKLSRDWTLLGRSAVTVLPDDDRTDARTQVGFAYRQTDANRWNGLMRYTHSLVDDRAVGGPTARTVTNVVSTHWSLQPSRPWLLETQLAGKWARDDHDYLTSRSNLQLVGGRVLYDVARGWDIGASGRELLSRNAAAQQYGAGGEVGRLLGRNLRLALGYNVFGFSDKDLAGDEYTDHGPYLHLGFKFDEGLFGVHGAESTAPAAQNGAKK